MKTLLWKIWTPYFLCIVGCFGILAMVTGAQLREHVQETEQDRMTTAIRAFSPHLESIWKPEDPGFQGILQNQCDSVANSLKGLRITVVSTDGTVLADTEENPAHMENHGDRPEVIDAGDSGLGTSIRYSSTLKQKMMYVAAPVIIDGKTLGTLRMAHPLRDLNRSLAILRNSLFATGVILVIFATAVSFGVARSVSQPLAEMRATAERFTNGDLSITMLKPDITELHELADAMNLMAGQLTHRLDTVSQQRNQLNAILAGMTEGVIALNKWGEVITVNNAAVTTFGLDLSQTVGHNLTHAIRHPEISAIHESVIESGKELRQDITISQYNDTQVLQVTGTPLLNAHQTPIGSILVFNDITRIKKLETLRKDFAVSVSHELRTPLTSMQGFAETLLDGADEDPETRKKFLKIIHKQAQRLNLLIQDLLKLSQVERAQEGESTQMLPLDLKKLLEDTVGLYQDKADKKNMSMTLHCDQELVILGNEILLGHAVGNLIDNAIAYSASGSAIHIEVKTASEQVAITVKDNGIGIATEYMERLFERFYRVDKSRSRNAGGTGLGLAIVKHVVELHHGQVLVESEPEKGSSFTIELPVEKVE